MLKVEDRISYYEALDLEGAKGECRPFIKMVAELEEASLQQYLALFP
ncbi:hypothetical protein J32TS2_01570 [Shouchella clausii]|nr:hypothetical protein DB29_02709 [Shouchella clausii]GIN05986.1 hypothetical protein J1TS1_01310 [Shouchella clausii]GIN14801.1 hypothetical protein J32TS2_01570 [Shouchella clausii]